MTQSMNVAIACPRCGAQDSVEIWTSVNRRDNPDEAQWLIDGFLFEHACPACGHTSTLNHDCLYHDPDRAMMVLFVADQAKAADALAALEQRAPEGYAVRLVPTREALREKAAILRDGLDDRAVEIVKFALFNKFVKGGEVDARARAYYGARDEDGSVIVEFVGAGEALETTVSRETYEAAASLLDDAQPAIVDRAWAAETFHQWEAADSGKDLSWKA